MMARARFRRELPPEILENVLACLPVHVLCRFRVVCKNWNQIISQPGFASLRDQAPRQASYVLFTPKVMDVKIATPETRRDWEILDMVEKRFYSLNDSFIAEYLSRSEEFKFGWYKYTLAADRGLIYAIFYGSGSGVRERHIVCNPVSKDFHEIVEPKPYCYYDPVTVVMSVDNATESYRIVTVEMYDSTRSRRAQVYLYDSTTSQWRKLCEMPGPEYRAYSSLFMEGVFYTLFVDASVSRTLPKLYSCDTETGAWSYIDVRLPRATSRKDKLQLVVSLGRLFYVEYRGLPASILAIREIMQAQAGAQINLRIRVTIWEILLAKKELMRVGKLSKDLKISRRILEERPQSALSDHAVAVGCANSIVVSSVAHRMEFDLVKNSWRHLPDNTDHMHGTIRGRDGICVGLVHLDLRKMSH